MNSRLLKNVYGKRVRETSGTRLRFRLRVVPQAITNGRDIFYFQNETIFAYEYGMP